MRKIQDILPFRSDFSPFLVHLTRPHEDGTTARDSLRQIIELKRLFAGVVLFEKYSLSDARFAVSLRKLKNEERLEYFGFISFTETPLTELHRFFNIQHREKNFQPYGLVFLKDKLKERGVSPVFYVNNVGGDKDALVRALATLIDTHPKEAAQILPLVAVFGEKLKPQGGAAPQKETRPDFTWEREWRFPFSVHLQLEFTEDDVLVGLCPDNESKEFESLFRPVKFIDPRLNVERYAQKINMARRRLKRGPLPRKL